MSTLAFPFPEMMRARSAQALHGKYAKARGKMRMQNASPLSRFGVSRAGAAVAEFPLKKFFFAGIFFLASLAGLYMYCIGSAIAHIVERKDAESEIRSLSARISELEIQVAAGEQSVGAVAAGEMGFREIAEVAFIARAGTSAVALALPPR